MVRLKRPSLERPGAPPRWVSAGLRSWALVVTSTFVGPSRWRPLSRGKSSGTLCLPAADREPAGLVLVALTAALWPWGARGSSFVFAPQPRAPVVVKTPRTAVCHRKSPTLGAPSLKAACSSLRLACSLPASWRGPAAQLRCSGRTLLEAAVPGLGAQRYVPGRLRHQPCWPSLGLWLRHQPCWPPLRLLSYKVHLQLWRHLP